MKNLKLVSLLAIVFHISLYGISQTKNQCELYVAPTLANVKNDVANSYYYDIKPGLRFDMGLSYMRRVHPKILLGAGINYSIMGSNTKYTTNNQTEVNKHYSNYVELPFKFSVQLYDSIGKSFFIDVNIINQWLVGAMTKFDDGDKMKMNLADLQELDSEIYSVALLFGATYQKRFANDVFLGLGPYFKFGIYESSLWSFGFKIAIGRHF